MADKKSKSSFTKKINGGILFIIILLAILNIQMIGFSRNVGTLSNALPAFLGISGGQQDSGNVGTTGQPNELDGLPDVLAIVNGYEILKSDVEEIVAQVEMQGGFASVDEILDQIILIRVLLQEAERRGHSVGREEVENAFIEQGIAPEMVREQIEMQGMDYDAFLDSQVDDVILMKLVEDERANVEVSEEDALEFFQVESQFFDEDAVFEDFKDEIIEFLESELAQEIVLSLADELVANADVQIFI